MINIQNIVKKKNFFWVDGNKIKTNKTLEQNNIKNNDVITLKLK